MCDAIHEHRRARVGVRASMLLVDFLLAHPHIITVQDLLVHVSGGFAVKAKLLAEEKELERQNASFEEDIRLRTAEAVCVSARLFEVRVLLAAMRDSSSEPSTDSTPAGS